MLGNCVRFRGGSWKNRLGPVGAQLYRFAQGERERANLRPVATWKPPAEIIAALCFELPAREPSHWDGALEILLHQLCAELNGRCAQTLEITAQNGGCARQRAPRVERTALRAR